MSNKKIVEDAFKKLKAEIIQNDTNDLKNKTLGTELSCVVNPTIETRAACELAAAALENLIDKAELIEWLNSMRQSEYKIDGGLSDAYYNKGECHGRNNLIETIIKELEK